MDRLKGGVTPDAPATGFKPSVGGTAVVMPTRLEARMNDQYATRGERAFQTRLASVMAEYDMNEDEARAHLRSMHGSQAATTRHRKRMENAPPVVAQGYLVPTYGENRLSVDWDRFVADLRYHLGPVAYIFHPTYGDEDLRIVPIPIIRFHRHDYEMRFQTGGMAGSSKRVMIEIFPTKRPPEPMIPFRIPGPSITVSAVRKMSDILVDIETKIFDQTGDPRVHE